MYHKQISKNDDHVIELTSIRVDSSRFPFTHTSAKASPTFASLTLVRHPSQPYDPHCHSFPQSGNVQSSQRRAGMTRSKLEWSEPGDEAADMPDNRAHLVGMRARQHEHNMCDGLCDERSCWEWGEHLKAASLGSQRLGRLRSAGQEEEYQFKRWKWTPILETNKKAVL